MPRVKLIKHVDKTPPYVCFD